MTEPLSVSGTAVGIVSLGLTVCQSLVNYYQSWKSFDADVASTCDLVNQLNIALGLVHETLQSESITGRRAVPQIDAILTKCRDGITQLDKRLGKIKVKGPNQQPQGRGDLARVFEQQRKRLLYPFRQGTLGKLRDVVTELLGVLEPAIVSLNLLVLF